MSQPDLPDLFTAFVERGFGTLTKKEIERLVYAQMIDSGWLSNPDDQYDVSRRLKISPQKAAALRYEYKLQRSRAPSVDELRRLFAQLLGTARYRKASGSKTDIVIEVRDRLQREQIEEFVIDRNLGTPIDYSFNRNLLQLDVATFSGLILELADEKQLSLAQSKLKNAPLLPEGVISKQALINALLEGAAKSAGNEIVSNLVGLLLPGSGLAKIISFFNEKY